MYVSEIYAQGFRCFPSDRPIRLLLKRGLNILVGPNDAGKTAILDIPRFVLWTRGDDYVRLEASDFYIGPDGKRCSSMLLRCTFSNLTEDEEARFLEWCTNERGKLTLHACLRGFIRQQQGGGVSVVTQFRAGPEGDGPPLEGDLREYLRATYLRPLRDAERELRSGRRSRLSKILGAMPHMEKQAQHSGGGEPQTLLDALAAADAAVDGNDAVKKIQQFVNEDYLGKLSFSDDSLTATLGLGTKGSFDQVLERLELYLDPPPGRSVRVSRGLGYNNLLFMAAELLLLQSHPDQVPFLLIEEPEAHLHPQHQILFMQILEERTTRRPDGAAPGQQVQILLTTHSPHLASNADLSTMILVTNQTAYPLDPTKTKLHEEDYGFLRRFLDATKANLFFARGLIVVEGDAENLLLPAIARKIGRPLGKHGVSIVNVGHRGLFRYSRIFQRSDGIPLPIPVALIPDRDIPPDAAKPILGLKKSESDWDANELAEHDTKLLAHDGGSVKTFPSEQWTLEFDLARQPDLATMVHEAIVLAKGASADEMDGLLSEARSAVDGWKSEGKSRDEIAALIYAPLKKKSVSKAEAAERLAELISRSKDGAGEFERKLPRNLVAAIRHVTGGADRSIPEAVERAPTLAESLDREPAE